LPSFCSVAGLWPSTGWETVPIVFAVVGSPHDNDAKGEQASREEAEHQIRLALTSPRMSTGDGMMDGVAPDNLTYANVMDGKIKYNTIRKNKLQVLCGNLLNHIKDLEVEKAKVELRLEEELKEAKVELRLEEELELKEAVFVIHNNGNGATSNGEDDVKGVEEGDVNVNTKLAKLAK
jgi:hypothetical protein